MERLASVIEATDCRLSQCLQASATGHPSAEYQRCCLCSIPVQAVSVVNIDNGFGAGYMASMINHMEAR